MIDWLQTRLGMAMIEEAAPALRLGR